VAFVLGSLLIAGLVAFLWVAPAPSSEAFIYTPF
jgi:hypothetical protein